MFEFLKTKNFHMFFSLLLGIFIVIIWRPVCNNDDCIRWKPPCYEYAANNNINNKNSLYDVLYERSLAEKNDTLRYKLYQQMDKLIIEDAPIVPLWYDMAIHLVHSNIKNFPPNSLNLLELRRTKKTP